MPKLPQNVWIIAAAFSFAMSGISLLLFVGGIIGTELAPMAALATLPLAIFVVGNAVVTIPAAICSQIFGRKKTAYIGFCTSQVSVIVCIIGLEAHNFYIFCLGCLLIGAGTAFYHQFRFAAIESLANSNDAGPALSVIMLCSIVGALIGPEFVSAGQVLLPNTEPYIGAFLLYSAMIACAMLLFSFFKNPPAPPLSDDETPRPISKMLGQSGFLIALCASAIGYALMSFLMTSTPISMHVVEGHSLDAAKSVIQAHLLAMFLPSLFSGYLVKVFGATKIMLLGSVLYLAVVAIATSGQHYIHYWWALVLLGVGWNFLFLSGTTLLPNYYRHNERFRAQAINDFSVFSLQACASLSAAWVLFQFGWQMQLWMCIPPTLLLCFAALRLIFKQRKTALNQGTT